MGVHDPYEALRHRDYRWFLAGSLAMMAGFQMQSLIMGWQVYGLTHDPLALGLVGLAEGVPFLALTLLGGWAADRWDRRRLSALSTLALLGGAFLLLALAFRPALRAVWPFYAIQAAAGAARALYRPASQALATELVPRNAFQNAATWRSSSIHLAKMAGPALGGLLYAFAGARLAYGAEALLMAFSVLSWMVIRRAPRRTASPAPLGAGLAEGARFILGERLVLAAMSLDLLAVLFGGALAMLPVFATEVLHVGPRGLGLLRAAPGAGAVLMALVQAHRPAPARAGRALLAAVAVFGLCWITFAFSRSLPLSALVLVASGAADNVSAVLRAALVQTRTPPSLMGRTQAINGLFIGSSNELGAFESGLAARWLGLVPSVAAGACATLMVVAAMAWGLPDLRRLGRIQG